MKRKFNNEHIMWLTNNTYKKPREQIVKEFNEHFGSEFTLGQINALMKRHKIRTDYVCKESWFKKGSVPHNAVSILSETVDSNGYVKIKIKDNYWVYKHRYLYELYHNVKLKDDDVIMFLDKDKTNFSKDNLVLVSKSESMYLTNNFNDIENVELRKSCVLISKIEMKRR